MSDLALAVAKRKHKCEGYNLTVSFSFLIVNKNTTNLEFCTVAEGGFHPRNIEDPHPRKYSAHKNSLKILKNIQYSQTYKK